MSGHELQRLPEMTAQLLHALPIVAARLENRLMMAKRSRRETMVGGLTCYFSDVSKCMSTSNKSSFY